jgi:hypothetical protein
MAIMARNSGGNYTPPPADTYPAVCVGVFDLGTQETAFGAKRQVRIMWEIDCDKSDGSHHTVSQTYTPSLNVKANFRKLIESWLGRKLSDDEVKNGYDVGKLLGQPCQLQVLHNESNGKTYANVGAVMKLAKGMQPLVPLNKPVLYSWDDHGRKMPNAMPEFIKRQVEQSLEWRGELSDEPETAPPGDTEPTLEEQGAATF